MTPAIAIAFLAIGLLWLGLYLFIEFLVYDSYDKWSYWVGLGAYILIAIGMIILRKGN